MIVRLFVRYSLVTLRWLWLLWLWIILIAGLLFLLLFALFYRLSDYRPQIEDWASNMLQQPIIIGDISTNWIDGAPTLELQKVRLISPDKSSFIDIPQVRVGLNMLTSLRQKQFITSQINLNIKQLTLKRQLDGSVHIVGIAESDTAQAVDIEAHLLLQWLLDQQNIQLQIGQLTWQELQRKPLYFEQIGLHLQKKSEQNHISGQVSVPIGETRQFITFSTVTEWKEKRLSQLNGQFQFTSAPNSPIFAAHIAVKPDQNQGWDIDLSHIASANQLNVKIRPNGHQYDISAKLAFLDLESLFLLAKRFLNNTDILEKLQSIAIKGQLKQVEFDYFANNTWKLKTKLDNIYLKHQKHKVKNLSGFLTAQPQQARIEIANGELDFVEPSLYSHHLNINQLQTDIHIQKQQQDVTINIDKLHFQEQQTPMQILGKVVLSQYKQPFLDLDVKIGRMLAKNVYRYIPDQEIANTADWLKKALLSGELENINLKLKGAVNTVFKLEKNQFQLTARAKQIKLNYAAGWFPIKKLTAQFEVANNQLIIKPQQAYLLGTPLQATVRIPKLTGNDKKVLISVKMETQAKKVFKYLYETPLSEKIDLERGKIQLTGNVGVNVDLAIGLDSQPDQIKGFIDLKNNQLQENFVGHIMQNVTGKLHFTDKKLYTKNVKATLWKQAIVLDFSLNKQLDKLIIQLNAQGKMDKNFINSEISVIKPKWKDLKLYQHFGGESTWQAKLDIVNFERQKHNNYTKVQFFSQLQGLDMRFPAPLNKISPLKMPLHIELLFPENARDSMMLSLGDLVNAVIELDENLYKGQVLIGTREKAKLPKTSRLDIKGYITHLGVKEWLQFWHDLPEGEGDNPLLPIDINLHLDQLGLWTQQFNQVEATLTHRAELWRIFVKSEAVLGQLQYHTKKEIVHAKLKYLNMAVPQKQYTSYQIKKLTNPFELPEISAHIDAFKFANKELGNVNLYGKPHEKGWELEYFESKANGLNIQARGLWQYQPLQAHSQLEIKLHSADNEQLLKRLGYAKSPIKQGFTEGLLEVDWNGGFDDFDLKTMQGHLRLLMTQGEIVDVDPGVGRIFGLFDVLILPKRLLLDFRDITDKGLRFDSIVGEFDIKDGIASTHKMILQSPVAHVEMQGHTHFVEEYYNQTVKIIPHVSNTLPVAGTLVGGLGVGAVTLIIQKMLQTELEKNLYYEYQVLGDWNDPQIKLISGK